VTSLKSCQKSPTIAEVPPPIPPLPLNYQRSDGELRLIGGFDSTLIFVGSTDESSFPMNDSKNELKKLRAMSKASKQAELKR
jgi:hypothetical protein